MSLALEVVEDPARACAAMMLGAAVGGGEIVLAGGSTPKAAYGEFVTAVGSLGLDVTGTRFWLGDERCVEPDDERANYRMVKAALLDPLGSANQPRVERMRGELGPEDGAAEYERRLHEAGDPPFDLVLLGIGPDGHTASLFPGKPALGVEDRRVVGVPEAGLEPFVPRVSLTLPALAAGHRVVILADGEGKAEAVSRAFGSGPDVDAELPAARLGARAEPLIVLIDPAAAAGLPG